MVINANTKIATLIKHNPAALDTIISITPKFEKLRNPLLRKLMAGRTSIGMASKVGGCDIDLFYEKLGPLGFEVEQSVASDNEARVKVPDFFHSLKPEQIHELDVRPIIESGADPLPQIMKEVKSVKVGEALKVINSFEPTPLLTLLKKQGFEYFVDPIGPDLTETYFFKTGNTEASVEPDPGRKEDWEAYLNKYEDHLQTVDVRHLPMPQPMMTILEAIENLPEEQALFVYHKKIPVFLLPELKDKGFDFRIKEIEENQVHLLIFKE